MPEDEYEEVRHDLRTGSYIYAQMSCWSAFVHVHHVMTISMHIVREESLQKVVTTSAIYSHNELMCSAIYVHSNSLASGV